MVMIGLSYGGFIALQIANLQLLHLSVIIPINFTDDRYADKWNYCGDLLHIMDDVEYYGNMIVAYNTFPPFQV